MKKFVQAALTGAAITLVSTTAILASEPQVVGMRRLTEAQYRNTIGDIFGPDISVAGRFEPVIRPPHQLISSGAAEAALSPTGIEQFDTMARNISSQVFDEAHRASFVKCTPKDEKAADAGCAEKTLGSLGRYVFRRPLTSDERKLYVTVANDVAKQTSSFYEGLQLSLAAMLVSPNFLFVVETAEPDSAHKGSLRLDNYARASRLSFLLWNTTPNDALLTAAEKGALSDQRKLEAITAQMVASPRLEDGVRAFFSDMLVYEKFEEMTKDPLVYPRFTNDAGKVIPEQMLRMIVDHLLTRSGDYRELFTTRHSVVTRALGPIYNIPIHSSTGWEPVEFAPDSDRTGLIGQAGFLALYSQVGRSSPTLRGRAVRELLLCQPVPDPPGNVNFNLVNDTSNAVLRTARGRLTQHDNDAVCNGCHKIIDPVGLALERFDGIGAFRTQENGSDIDIAGTINGEDYVGVAGLGAKIAANPAATQCVANRAVEYAAGHVVKDQATVEGIQKSFATDGYRIRTLFHQVATSSSLYEVPPAVDQPKPQKTAMSDVNKSTTER